MGIILALIIFVSIISLFSAVPLSAPIVNGVFSIASIFLFFVGPSGHGALYSMKETASFFLAFFLFHFVASIWYLKLAPKFGAGFTDRFLKTAVFFFLVNVVTIAVLLLLIHFFT